jgi:transposase-like protein
MVPPSADDLRHCETDMGPIQCPYCGSYTTAREPGQWEWVWLIAAAASLFLRWLMTFARYGLYRGEPGVYRCGTCGRAFTFFV